jgi:hypothetical protein
LPTKYRQWTIADCNEANRFYDACVKYIFLNPLDIMKKTLLSAIALLLTLSVVGCQPPATDIEATGTTAEPAADSNVTATAETPAVTETPADAPAEAPAE